MYGGNYFIKSSGLPLALVFFAPSVTDLCLSLDVYKCVCICERTCLNIHVPFFLINRKYGKLDSGELNSHANFMCFVLLVPKNTI